MTKVDYEALRVRLQAAFAEAQSKPNVRLAIPKPIGAPLHALFTSKTQAFREGFLGALLVKLEHPEVNISHPYVKHGPDSFNGRTVDEKVVNPFLKSERIPSSRGPYLSVLRRGVKFKKETLVGIRDTKAFEALIELVDYAKVASKESRLALLRIILEQFIALRESSEIPVSRLNRLSHRQYEELLNRLGKIKSGGKIPVMLVTATLHSMIETFALPWKIEAQDINEADSASGAEGDIVIREGERAILAIEVTERKVELNRLKTTFQQKISPSGIEDYIFLVKKTDVAKDVEAQAQRYFSQGSEVNFVDLREWLLMVLIMLGKDGRSRFNKSLVEQVESEETSAAIKVGWNEAINGLTDQTEE